jgi:hypothetical protein
MKPLVVLRHTRNPSDGSVPAIAPALAAVSDSTSSINTVREKSDGDNKGNSPMSTTTNVSSSSTSSVMLLKSLWTSLPDSENHLENKECELISRRRACEYLLIYQLLSMFLRIMTRQTIPMRKADSQFLCECTTE